MIPANASVTVRKSPVVAHDDLGLPVRQAGAESVHAVLLEWTGSTIVNSLEATTSTVDAVVHFVDGYRDIDPDDVIVINGKDFAIKGEVKRHAAPPNFSLRIPVAVELQRVEV